MLAAETSAVTGQNDPRAVRMGIIAFLNQNLSIACLYGSFSVLLLAVQAHLSVTPQMAVMGVPAVNLATAFGAPIAGGLANRFSLRQIMLIGSSLSVLGFALLAVSNSYVLYIVAYGLLIGPGMASVGVVLPATLVTRWFVVNRGKALGLVCTPLAIAAMPFLATWMLQSNGLAAAYWMLAALSAISVAANFFVIDWPPDASPRPAADSPHGAAQPAAVGGVSVGTLLKSPKFWAITLAGIAPITGAVILTANMVPMAAAWGLTAAQGAVLLSMQSIIGIAGTLIFGWVVDRLGGVLSLALVVFDGAILWALLLLHPSFEVRALIVGLIGLHGSGSLPVTGAALSELFGRESFSRVYGIFNLINLPFAVLCVPLSAYIYARTGSYADAVIGEAALLAIAIPSALLARAGRQPRATGPLQAG
jgi:MFS family permease